MNKVYYIKIDRATCKATIVNKLSEADYVFEDWSDSHARMKGTLIAIHEKWDKIGIFAE